VVTAECADTEFGDLEGLLLQIANEQDMVEPQSDLSGPIPYHNFNQVCLAVYNLFIVSVCPLDG